MKIVINVLNYIKRLDFFFFNTLFGLNVLNWRIWNVELLNLSFKYYNN